MRNRGFSLIELLVVIAIIAILAAILFPLMKSAKDAGMTSSCASNTREMTRAISLYVDDYNDVMVPAWLQPSASSTDAYTWRLLIRKYYPSRKAYVCPANPKGAKDWGQVGMTDGSFDFIASYGINMDVSGRVDQSAGWGIYVYKRSRYERPSRTLLVVETLQGFFYPNFSHLENQNYLKTLFPYFHKGKLNVSFLDGHVKTMYLYDTLKESPQEFMWYDIPPGDTTTLYKIRKIKRWWPAGVPPIGGG